MTSGRMPRRVNHARIGEAILLGRETTHRQPLPGAFQDAFMLHAEVLELKRKPSLPIGARGENAFGHLTTFENHGVMTRALLNIGREEVEVEGLTPQDSRLTILGASSGMGGATATAMPSARRSALFSPTPPIPRSRLQPSRLVFPPRCPDGGVVPAL